MSNARLKRWGKQEAAWLMIGLVVGMYWFVLHHGNSERPTPASSSKASSATNRPSSTSLLSPPGPPLNPLRAALEGLKTSRDAGINRLVLAELRDRLNALPPGVAVAAIREFLASHADAATHLDFTIGPNGLLKDAPSLRVFLLDYLGEIDRAAAADEAEKILRSMESPDEWAVSLRNYARGKSTPEARTFLEEKVGQMLVYEPWRQNPSTGFLEAFDVAVYVGGTKLIPILEDYVRQTDQQAVAHAAFLSLDRLTLQDPLAVLSVMLQQPDLMKGREATRANYFARANVEDSGQKALLEQYLLNPALGAGELEAFAGLYPNANFMISPNLLTSNVTPNRATLAQRDQAALRVVEAWLPDPRFDNLKPQLETIRARLAEFVRQASHP